MSFDVEAYWTKRYSTGGNSGWGSHDLKSINFKAEYINKIIIQHEVKTVCELGCGDGNQLKYFSGYTKYYGYDISGFIVNKCINIYSGDDTKNFVYNVDDLEEDKFDLILSLDVIYHLVEQEIFEKHMDDLFKLSNLVCIFSTDCYEEKSSPHHIKARKITKHVEENYRKFKLIDSKRFYDVNDSDNNVGFFLYKKEN